jgi:hypothetical protein
MGCLDPPLHDVPTGDWFCPDCVAEGIKAPQPIDRGVHRRPTAASSSRKRRSSKPHIVTAAESAARYAELLETQDLRGKALPLPPSSFDLLLPAQWVMDAIQVYEVLRRFSSPLGLTSFRFEDFCHALIEAETSPLLAHAHTSLLRSLLKFVSDSESLEDDLDWALLDEFTWPFVLCKLLRRRVDSVAYPAVHSAALHLSTVEYDELAVPERLAILLYLTEEYVPNPPSADRMRTRFPAFIRLPSNYRGPPTFAQVCNARRNKGGV